MTWQVDYAIETLGKTRTVTSVEKFGNEGIVVAIERRPSVVAVISEAEIIPEAMVIDYHAQYPTMDFLCGMRKTCVWEGRAIDYAEGHSIGWGSMGTLVSAILDEKVKSASHKDFAFSDRLLRHSGHTSAVDREYDRVHTVTVKSGRKIRIAMIREYEPTADHVRSLWDQFGAVDVAWNINPNGKITLKAIEAGHELGCEVLKWDDLKTFLKKA
jgi:hypothetical protein